MLYPILALWPHALQFPAARFAFRLCLILFVFIRSFFCLVNQNRTKGEGWSTANQSKLLPPPSNFIAGRPKAALLFWFLSDFRGGVPLFIVILVIYKYKNR